MAFRRGGPVAMRFDLVLTGGHVIDPATGVDGRRDVAFATGRVAAVDHAIPGGTAREVVDVTDAYVVPGLIDLHAHAFIAGHDLGVETDPVCRATGVTTDRKSTRLNSSHRTISYAVFCLKKKKIKLQT